MDAVSDMAVFAQVVDSRGFSAAAARLGLSKSAVSKRVGRLEGRLGARLLNRTTRRLSLTEEGAAYYARCQRILADIEEAEAAVARLHDEPRGTLRVNAPMSFSLLHLAPAIPEFLALYPELRIDLTLADRFVDLVNEGYDLAVRVARLPDSSLIARKLAPARVVLCAAPDYLRRHGRPRVPADLSVHNCLVYSNLPRPEEWRLMGPDGPVSVRVSGNYRADNGDVLRRALLAGMGIGLLPTFLVGRDVQGGALESVLDGAMLQAQSVYAVYPPGGRPPAKLRAFIDFLAGRFGPEPYWDTEPGAA
ncbi:MAG: LysR family transcriptional regulator [Alphaproteobacteria bacterium]